MKYLFVTGHELGKNWKDSNAFHEKLEAFYGELTTARDSGLFGTSFGTYVLCARMFRERPTAACQIGARSLFGCGTAALGAAA